MRFFARLLALFLVVRAYKNRADEGSTQRGHRQMTTDLRDRTDAGSASGIPTQRSDGPGPDSPLDLEPRDLKQTLKRTAKEIKDDRITFAAAGMAYYFFLAIFPAVIAMIGILGLVNVDASGLVDSISSTLPGGSGREVVRAIANAEASSQQASLTAAIAGIALALWSASSGFVALQEGLNIAYDVKVSRKFFGKRAIALALLVGTLLLGGVPSPFFTFGESTVYQVIGWVLTIVAVMVMFSLYYYLAPNRESPTWQWVSGGGIVGALIWIAASTLFSVYVETFSNYSKTYGSLAGVIVLILFLYLSSLAVLIGGELNAELERQGAKKAA